MDTNKLKKFAQEARMQLIAQVSAKLKLVLAEGSAARREAPSAVQELLGEIRSTSETQVIEKVAYTWFNRFTALRFMDANGYTVPRVVTPADGQTRPELLADAAAGVFADGVSNSLRSSVSALLDGRTPSRDPQGEAYRLLLVAACNEWHKHMPFMFEKISDYTELLMPDDLLSQESILSRMRAVMTDEDCQDVEIIGWLYQFYISEKKDQVFAALKKNVKITAENIPAATQLFTPHWIVRYLVENSLGRLWLLNRPGSKLAAQMDYYIAPEEPETDFLKIGKPEEIKVCDPACGSGHMLTYAFDLLYAIYEEEGYDATEIPALILKHNLTGVEIDDRAGALAAFALAMKAAEKLGRRRFLRLDLQPNIVVLQNVTFTAAELTDVAAVVGKDLFTDALRETLTQFEQAKNFGSLITPKLRDPAEALRRVEARDFSSDLLLKEMQARVVSVLRMAEALSPKYYVVVANPPYAGGKGLNKVLSAWLYGSYRGYNSDLFAAFIKRISGIVVRGGASGLMTPFTWMFISSYEDVRKLLTEKNHITSLVRPEYHAFFESAYVPICAFTIQHSKAPEKKGVFVDLNDFVGADVQAKYFLEAIRDKSVAWRHQGSSTDFHKVPGSPIAYWLSSRALDAFEINDALSAYAEPRQGLITGDNDRFLRQWFENERDRTCFEAGSRSEAKASKKRWFPHHKGGSFRKWYGNHEFVVDWENDGAQIRNFLDDNGKLRSRPQNLEYYFRPAATWTSLTVGAFNARICRGGFVYDAKGPMAKPIEDNDLCLLTALLNSSSSNFFLKLLAPTMDYNQGPVGRLPWAKVTAGHRAAIESNTSALVEYAQSDWDAYETSWDFTTLPLLTTDSGIDTFEAAYSRLRARWQSMTNEMQRLEEENNRIFIDAYGLSDELTPEVPLDEITLTCNPAYRYGGKLSQDEQEARLLADTMAEFLHYAVGCMFGRYSLDKPGLILANQGEGLADYLAQVPEPTFMPDEDNVIPVLDGDWFADDITERFRKFLRVTFGEEKFQENLAFIEGALGKDIRKWFTTSFFDYHVRRFKKRPIYWMFSSPKGNFNALIYMHRYRPDTVSVLLNDYLREFISKLQAERIRLEKLADDPSASQSQKTRALKEVGTVIKQIDELTDWERDVVFPLAQSKIEIDLDDGVKRNYPKFGSALKLIKGLEASDDE